MHFKGTPDHHARDSFISCLQCASPTCAARLVGGVAGRSRAPGSRRRNSNSRCWFHLQVNDPPTRRRGQAKAKVLRLRYIYPSGFLLPSFVAAARCAHHSHRTGARIVFYRGAEFLNNVGTGYGGAILNHGELDFDNSDDDDDDDDGELGGGEEAGEEGVEASSFTLSFDGNYCGEQEVSQDARKPLR